MEARLRIATEAASTGAEVLRDRAGTLGDAWSKSSSVDLVTDVDIASGVAVVRHILEMHPAARFVVEEQQVCELLGIEPASLSDPEVWVIDPLDGTTSYVHSYPCYSVSVALLREGRPVAGAVCNAATGEMYAAAAGSGATHDGAAIRTSEADSVSGALLATGFPYDRAAPLDRQLHILERVLRSAAHDVRRDGSAAIDCCQVACGRVDGFWELALRPWDTAAGTIIVEEAGGVVTDFQGRPWSTATADHVVAGRRLHPVLLELVREVECENRPGLTDRR